MNANVWAMTGMRADGDRWRLARKDGGGGGGARRQAGGGSGGLRCGPEALQPLVMAGEHQWKLAGHPSEGASRVQLLFVEPPAGACIGCAVHVSSVRQRGRPFFNLAGLDPGEFCALQCEPCW